MVLPDGSGITGNTEVCLCTVLCQTAIPSHAVTPIQPAPMKTYANSKTRRSENGKAVVRLSEIAVDGYRSCRSCTFKPHREVSALIGINGAGKTNILNAIRLLSARSWRSSRFASDTKAANETVVTAWFDVGGKRIGLRLTLKLTESNRNTDEVIGVSESWNFASITGSKVWKLGPPLNLWSKPSSKLMRGDLDILYLESERLSTSFPIAFAGSGREFDPDLWSNKDVMQVAHAVYSFRKRISYYSASQFTDPTKCPSSFEIDEDSRISEAWGVSQIHQKFISDLYTLKTTNPDLYTEYEAFVSRQHLGLISRITWKAIELSSNTADVKSGGSIRKIRKTKTLVIPKIQLGASYITFNQLSEGTFKTLALVFYVMTDTSSCLLIEEPEVCVHHGLLSRIIETIKAYSNSTQVIFSTHSDLLIDSMKPENTFVVEMQKSGTKVTALDSWVGVQGRHALHAYLEESGTLGEYWRSGGLS